MFKVDHKPSFFSLVSLAVLPKNTRINSPAFDYSYPRILIFPQRNIFFNILIRQSNVSPLTSDRLSMCCKCYSVSRNSHIPVRGRPLLTLSFGANIECPTSSLSCSLIYLNVFMGRSQNPTLSLKQESNLRYTGSSCAACPEGSEM